MKRESAPIHFLLPLAAFVLSTVLIAVPVTQSYLNLQRIAHGMPAVRMSSHNFEVLIPRHSFLSYSLEFGSQFHSKLVRGLNVAALPVGHLAARLLAETRLLYLPLEAQETFTLPIFCIPCWWFVGLGIETLLGRRRLHWSALLFGSLLSALWWFLFISFSFAISPEERAELTPPLWTFALWGALFAVLPAAWIAQSRRQAHPQELSS